MNAIAAHKAELEKLLQDLSSDRVVSGTTFVACVEAYITRLDTNWSDLDGCVTPPAAHRDSEVTHEINIDSKLHALLGATQNFKTARGVLSKTSRCAPASTPDVYLRVPHGEQPVGLTFYPHNERWSILLTRGWS